MPMPQKDFYLTPVVEFVDKVPKEMIDKIRPCANENTEGIILHFNNEKEIWI